MFAILPSAGRAEGLGSDSLSSSLPRLVLGWVSQAPDGRVHLLTLAKALPPLGKVANGHTSAQSRRIQATPAINDKLRKHMPAKAERLPSASGASTAHIYPSELQPMLQSLLAILSEIDFEHESDIETVKNSSVDELLKQAVITKLQERHRTRRAPHVQQLIRLLKRMQAVAA
jgi:hypothetical protein